MAHPNATLFVVVANARAKRDAIDAKLQPLWAAAVEESARQEAETGKITAFMSHDLQALYVARAEAAAYVRLAEEHYNDLCPPSRDLNGDA